MALCPLETVKYLKHRAELCQCFFDFLSVVESNLPLNDAELVSNASTILQESRKVIFLKDLGQSLRRQAHQVFLDIVDVHVALSQHVASSIHVSLHKEGEHQLIKALDFLSSEVALLVSDSFNEVRALLHEPGHHGVSECLPRDVSALTSRAWLALSTKSSF